MWIVTLMDCSDAEVALTHSKNLFEWQNSPTSCLTYWPDAPESVQSPALRWGVSRYQTDRRERRERREREGRSASAQTAAVAGAESSYHRWFICKFSLLSADYEVIHDMIGGQHHHNITTGTRAADWSRKTVENIKHLSPHSCLQ